MGDRKSAGGARVGSGAKQKQSFLRRGERSNKSGIVYPPLVMRRDSPLRLKMPLDHLTLSPTEANPSEGWNTLMFASKQGNLKIVQDLIQHGTRLLVREVESKGNTALHIAAHYGHMEITEYLLRHGADVNATALDGCTPLDRAVKQDRRMTARFLMTRNAVHNVFDPSELKCAGSRTTLSL